MNGPGTAAEDILLKDGDVLVADTDCPDIIEEVTPANFISFGWQIASGMVKSHSTYRNMLASLCRFSTAYMYVFMYIYEWQWGNRSSLLCACT